MFTPLEGVVEPGAQDMFSPWINNAEVFANRGLQNSGFDASFNASFQTHSVTMMAPSPAANLAMSSFAPDSTVAAG